MSMNLTIIMADARYLALRNNANSTAYGDTDIKRNINRWYNTVIEWILSANGEWQVNGEEATADLVAAQREYVFPIDILKLNEVYIKYETAGDYYKATQRDASEISSEPDQTNGYYPELPEYDLLDNSLFIYLPITPIPAITAGIKIHYQTDLTELSSGTDSPNLSEPFKRLLSAGAAYDYCIANEMYAKGDRLKLLIAELKQDLLNYYASKSTVKPARLEFKKRSFK